VQADRPGGRAYTSLIRSSTATRSDAPAARPRGAETRHRQDPIPKDRTLPA